MSARHHLIATMALLSAASATTAAAATAYHCNACSESQYTSSAVSRAQAAGQAHGVVYIYDFANNHFRKYNVEREPGAGGAYLYSALMTYPTAPEQHRFDLAREAWNLNGHTSQSLKVTENVPVGSMRDIPPRTGNANAYGVVMGSAQQSDIRACILNQCFNSNENVNPTVLENVLGILSDAAGILFNNNPVSLKVIVTMNDGSQVTFEWNPPASQPVVTFAIDSNGNAIPLTASQLTSPAPPYGSVFDFSQNHSDLNSFVLLANSHGVPVAVGSGWIVACVGVAGDRHCVAQPN